MNNFGLEKIKDGTCYKDLILALNDLKQGYSIKEYKITPSYENNLYIKKEPAFVLVKWLFSYFFEYDLKRVRGFYFYKQAYDVYFTVLENKLNLRKSLIEEVTKEDNFWSYIDQIILINQIATNGDDFFLAEIEDNKEKEALKTIMNELKFMTSKLNELIGLVGDEEKEIIFNLYIETLFDTSTMKKAIKEISK